MKHALLVIAFISMFVAGYCLGYYQRGHIYKERAEVEMALDRLPESLAISAITGSEVGSTHASVELMRPADSVRTNRPIRREWHLTSRWSQPGLALSVPLSR